MSYYNTEAYKRGLADGIAKERERVKAEIERYIRSEYGSPPSKPSIYSTPWVNPELLLAWLDAGEKE